MSDVTMARELMQETWPERAGRPVKSCIAVIFDAVRRVERRIPDPALRERPRQWTERRVRSIWNGEARRIDSGMTSSIPTVRVKRLKPEFERLVRGPRRRPQAIAEIELVAALTRLAQIEAVERRGA